MKNSILSAVQSGDRLESLKQLRDKLAKTLDETSSAREIPPLAKRLSDTLAEIERLESEMNSDNHSVVDEIIKGRK